MEHINWNGFNKGVWQDEINVRDFIQTNYTEYTGDEAFLQGATDRTKELMKKLEGLFALVGDGRIGTSAAGGGKAKGLGKAVWRWDEQPLNFSNGIALAHQNDAHLHLVPIRCA